VMRDNRVHRVEVVGADRSEFYGLDGDPPRPAGSER
jgi:hypothetical protein